eukprot:135459_1
MYKQNRSKDEIYNIVTTKKLKFTHLYPRSIMSHSGQKSNNNTSSSKTSFVKEGWGSMNNFAASYGFKRDADGYQQANDLAWQMYNHHAGNSNQSSSSNGQQSSSNSSSSHSNKK